MQRHRKCYFSLDQRVICIYCNLGSQTWSGTISVDINECKKVDLSNTVSTNTSDATLIEGTYTGMGDRLPSGISLGNLPACSNVSYQNNIQSGAANLTINALTDTTISLQFSSSAFSMFTIASRKISRNGNIISFESHLPNGLLAESATYDVSTGNFVFSGINLSQGFSYGSTDCLLQYPYVIGYDFTPSGQGYIYSSIDHLEFSGIKN